jgi:hypothetical protein
MQILDEKIDIIKFIDIIQKIAHLENIEDYETCKIIHDNIINRIDVESKEIAEIYNLKQSKIFNDAYDEYQTILYYYRKIRK